MNVRFDPDRCHQAVFDDDDFQYVIEQAAKNKDMLMFVAAAIRQFESHEEVVHGKLGSKRNMESRANEYFKDKRSRENGVAMARRFAALYGRFDPGTVRGCLIESMVEGRLRQRYQPSHLDNNVFVAVANYRTSTSVDVAAHDGERGEAHDCKAQGRAVKTSFIDEMATNLIPHGFRIGIATAESTSVAMQAITSRGYTIPHTVVVTGPERWWDGLPLWRA